MAIDQRLPDLSDGELESLHANAVRLAQSGAPQQRRQAEELLPLIGAVIEERRHVRAAQALQARRSATQRSAVAKRAKDGLDLD